MKAALIGIGGVGGAVAAALMDGPPDLELTLVAGKESYGALKKRGLVVRSQGIETVYPTEHLVESVEDLPVQDALVLCTKYCVNPSIVGSLRKCSTAATVLLPLQNGLSKIAYFKEEGFLGEVVDAVIHSCSRKVAPGIIDVLTWPTIRFGRCGTRARDVIQHLFARAPLAVVATNHDVDDAIWNKFGLVISISVVSSILESPCSRILAHEEAFALFLQLAEEFIAYANACGQQLVLDQFLDYCMGQLARMDPSYMPSMALDLLEGRGGELEPAVADIVSSGVAGYGFARAANILEDIRERHGGS